MNYEFSPEQKDIKKQIREFLRVNPPEKFPVQAEDNAMGMGAWSREFIQALAKEGWITRFWPQKYGGEGRSVMEHLVATEELAYNHAPTKAMTVTEPMSRTIMEYGNDFLKAEFLPRIGAGEIFFWMSFSEPEAGSDLLAVKTRAIEDGDYFILNGQKVWSSDAHLADYAYVLARTDPNVPRHKGLSMFIVDKNTPGVTVRPMHNLLGEPYHCEVFLDDVKVHKKYLIGEKNKGIFQMLDGLATDRFWARLPKHAWAKKVIEQLVEYANEVSLKGRALAENSLIRNRLADIASEIEANRLYYYQVAWLIQQGKKPVMESSIAKLMADEIGVRLFDLGLQMLSMSPHLDHGSKWTEFKWKMGRWQLMSTGHTIAGGTSEIQRNTIATQGLGLPRD